ncbi:MAG: hypothetical protein DWQ01_01280 [Planctomycetota bacterium]|nr:MAG: hypothetical protein DWQ01_01280 [Planctomycetota bacterium]
MQDKKDGVQACREHRRIITRIRNLISARWIRFDKSGFFFDGQTERSSSLARGSAEKKLGNGLPHGRAMVSLAKHRWHHDDMWSIRATGWPGPSAIDDREGSRIPLSRSPPPACGKSG